MNKFEWFMFGNLIGSSKQQNNNSDGGCIGSIIAFIIIISLVFWPLKIAWSLGFASSGTVFTSMGIESEQLPYIAGALGVVLMLYLYWKIYYFFFLRKKGNESPWTAATTIEESPVTTNPQSEINANKLVPVSYEESLTQWRTQLIETMAEIKPELVEIQAAVVIAENFPKSSEDVTVYRYGVDVFVNNAIFYYTEEYYFEERFLFTPENNGARHNAKMQILNTARHFSASIKKHYPNLTVKEFTRIDIPDELYRIE